MPVVGITVELCLRSQGLGRLPGVRLVRIVLLGMGLGQQGEGTDKQQEAGECLILGLSVSECSHIKLR